MNEQMEAVRLVLDGRWEGASIKAGCPVHDDAKHLYVQPPDRDSFPTFVCRKEADWGSELQPALIARGVPAELLRGSARDAAQPKSPLPSEARLKKWTRQLLHQFTHFRDYLESEVGLTREQMQAHGLGARTEDGRDERITIPVRSESGELVGVRLWNPFIEKSTGRQKVWVPGHEGTQHLLGAHKLAELPEDDLLLVVEGEPDYLAAVAAGVPVVAVTAGAGSVPRHLSPLAGRRVVVCFDNDEAGRTGARKQAHAYLSAGAEAVWIADIAHHVPDPGADLRDWLVGGGGSPDRLREWLEKVTAEHPLSLADLEQHAANERVRERFDNLMVERAARRMVAVHEASGLFPGFADTPLDALLVEDREPTPWLIEHLLRHGHKAVLTAAFKVGKTTLLTNVVRSLVDAEPLFDRFPVPAFDANVVVFDHELTREDAADLYERVAIGHSDRVHVQSLRGSGFSLANDVHCEQTIEYLRRVECGVWVIDPYARAMRGFGSENSNDDVGAFLATVDQIAAEAGLLGVVISAHTGRGEQLVGSEHARGATKIDDDPDARWIYTRDEAGVRFFRAEGRNRVGCDEFAMDFNPDTERLTASTMTRSDSKYYAKAKAATRIVLGAGEGGMKATDLQGQMAGKDEKPKRDVIKYAVRQGWLTEDARGGRNGTWYTRGPERFEDKIRLP